MVDHGVETHVYQGVRFRDGSLGVVLIALGDAGIGVSLAVIVPYQATVIAVGSAEKTYGEFTIAINEAVEKYVEPEDYQYVLEKVHSHAAHAYHTLWTP